MEKITARPVQDTSMPSFKDFLFHDSFNRRMLIFSAVAIIVQFVVFKLLYPYAGFINGDSYHYLDAALWNQSINTYMIGYSKFLRLFSVFSSSDTALVAFQYLSVQSSALLLLFTLFYFYNPGKSIRLILLCFMTFNPLFLYMSNYVTSDVLFLSLSLIWLSILIWIIHRPTSKLILLHAVALFIAFTFRYNALSYPFIAIVAFSLSSGLSMSRKIGGIAISLLLVGLFMLHTAGKYRDLTGKWQYSPFSGWQLANNAMYAYKYIDSANRKPVPQKFKQLDDIVRTYFDSTRNTKKHPEESLIASTLYMWDPRSPLYKYRLLQFKNDTLASEFHQWASMGPFYSDYGSYIIKQYPGQFLKYFIWPNFYKYYATPVEFLDRYNSRDDTVASIAQWWFKYKTNKVRTAFKDPNVHVLDFYPILAGTMNVIFVAAIFCFFGLKGFRHNPLFAKAVLLAATIWAVNFGFTVFASSAALRFQAFPILTFTCFAGLLLDYIFKESLKPALANNHADASFSPQQVFYK